MVRAPKSAKAPRRGRSHSSGSFKGATAWLKRSLRTKDEARAKVLAKPVMMEFDRIIADAEALLVQHPVRTTLKDSEIKPVGLTTVRTIVLTSLSTTQNARRSACLSILCACAGEL